MTAKYCLPFKLHFMTYDQFELNYCLAGYSHLGFNSWFNPCKVSKFLIQRFSWVFESSDMASFGLLVFVILSINVHFACLLNLSLSSAKWQHAGIAFLSNMLDMWLLRRKLKFKKLNLKKFQILICPLSCIFYDCKIYTLNVWHKGYLRYKTTIK